MQMISVMAGEQLQYLSRLECSKRSFDKAIDI
jgi:hypothetical protein